MDGGFEKFLAFAFINTYHGVSTVFILLFFSLVSEWTINSIHIGLSGPLGLFGSLIEVLIRGTQFIRRIESHAQAPCILGEVPGISSIFLF